MHGRHEYDVLAKPLQVITSVAAHAYDAATARLNFLDVGHNLLEYFRVFLGDDDDRHAVVDECNVAVLHLSSRKPFSVNVADFFQFQGTFERHGIVNRAP